MKRLITVITAAAMILGCTAFMTGCSSKDDNTSSINITDLNGVLDFYKSKTEDQEYQNEIDMDKRQEMLKLPKDALKNLSTEDLVDAILHYPYFFDWKKFKTCEQGVEYLNETIDTMQELQNRSDAASVLLKKYADQKVYSEEDLSSAGEIDNKEIFRIEDIELLITQDYVLAQMTEEEHTQFLEIAKQKQEEKDISGIYIIDPEMIPEVLRNLE